MATSTNNDDPSELRPRGGKRKKKKPPRPQPKTKTQAKEIYSMDLEFLEDYCMSRTIWDEVMPILYMMEIRWGLHPPPPVAAVINKVKAKFNKLEYGPMIDSHDVIQGDKNNFEPGADLNKMYMSQGISAQDTIKELTKQQNYGKRQSKRRSQRVSCRKHDVENVSNQLPKRSR